MAVQRVVTQRFTGSPGAAGSSQFRIADRDTAVVPLAAGEYVVADGTLQVETATVVGTIVAPVQQVETATITGTIVSPVQQVETATVVGTITGAGNAKVVVTSAGMIGSPRTVSVAVANTDTSTAVATKMAAALVADANVNAFFIPTSSGANVILTARTAAANDSTLNIATDNDTCTGLTTEPTSANTTAGVPSGAGNAAVIVTASGMSNSPKTVLVPVAAGDVAATIATKVRTALAADSDVSSFFTVSGTSTAVVLTAITAAANDATMNIDVDNATSTGITDTPVSTHTTAGVASGAGTASVTVTAAGLPSGVTIYAVPVAGGDNATAVAGKIKTTLSADSKLTTYFNVTSSGANVILTAVTPGNNGIAPANDSTLNIAIDNGTCVGLTPAPTSTHTTAGVTGGLIQDWTNTTTTPTATPTSAPYYLIGSLRLFAGTGAPGLPSGVTPLVGDIYIRSDGGVGNTLYRATVGGPSPTWIAIL